MGVGLGIPGEDAEGITDALGFLRTYNLRGSAPVGKNVVVIGGGQPRFTDNRVRQARIAAIYQEDEGKRLRKSHENPEIEQLYREFLGHPLGEKSHRLLHTRYAPRERI